MENQAQHETTATARFIEGVIMTSVHMLAVSKCFVKFAVSVYMLALQ